MLAKRKEASGNEIRHYPFFCRSIRRYFFLALAIETNDIPTFICTFLWARAILVSARSASFWHQLCSTLNRRQKYVGLRSPMVLYSLRRCRGFFICITRLISCLVAGFPSQTFYRYSFVLATRLQRQKNPYQYLLNSEFRIQ